MDDRTIVMDITGGDLERQAHEVARPAPHRTLRPALNGYRREDVDQALAAADKRNADLERDNAALSGVCENTRALAEDLQRRLGAAEERRRAVERERDGYRGQLENPWRAVGEAGENLVKAARAQADRIRADAERSAEEVRAKAAKAMDEAHAEAERTRKALHGELAAHDKAMTEREARADKAVKDARATVAKAYGIVKDVLDSFDEA
ncbi:hypothetical protein [Bifidobacterium adolescentis]|uniref:hypothetical protein n=1 Tax=Bifidobacterium adolescentis TaxID=1680 RepID=UPI0022E6B3EE|nr:hypothetical protein [Bifidobacterium adolescentis]